MEDLFAMFRRTLTCARLIFALHLRDAIILDVVGIQSFFCSFSLHCFLIVLF